MPSPLREAEGSSDLQLLHRVIRYMTGVAAASFFTQVHVIGGENVPREGPIIVTATHHNMMLDPVILSYTFPYARILNYWSKASLFLNPIAAWVLYSSGNIPVDRRSKDRRVLLRGTIEALEKGWAVALFPEGTSYTEPRIMQVKDGAAWAALEYARMAKEKRERGEGSGQQVKIVPAAIVYTDKTKYRSNVVVEYSPAISMEPFLEQFCSDEEGAAKAAVKRLTRAVEASLVSTTINGPDWDTLYVARMARDIMWEDGINLDDWVAVSQTLVDLFATPDATSNMQSVKRTLLEYYSLLQSTNLTNSVLSSLPLPRTLDPNTPTPLPGRIRTLLILVRETVTVLIQLPFFLFPLVVYMPVYFMGRLGAQMVEDEEETQAQNKLVFGMLSMVLIYPTAFFFLWAFFTYTRTGALIAAATLWLFAKYHDSMINANYQKAKRLLATWRVITALWGPKRWDLSLAALTPYMTPVFPKESDYVTKPRTPVPGSPAVTPIVLPPEPQIGNKAEPRVQTRPKRRRPSSRRIMRHVLRARVEAVKALAMFFEQLRAEKDKKVAASVFLAETYGGAVADDQGGWRYASEVVQFLTRRGAKIPQIKGVRIDGDWAALTSDVDSDAN
ncbi:unnamed protein product [Mycena citricolor]|uniref:Phospholipid/glycerol acyltransferase domain-containing protein n=1 Tax=Mycena citricolor TaxID=2018698 RepID=A0AAD2GY84_9AGAR|nr:unnamed protein product [Mycena citricolor]